MNRYVTQGLLADALFDGKRVVVVSLYATTVFRELAAYVDQVASKAVESIHPVHGRERIRFHNGGEIHMARESAVRRRPPVCDVVYLDDEALGRDHEIMTMLQGCVDTGSVKEVIRP